MEWEKLTEERKKEKLDRLQGICNELLIHHPNYKNFRTAEIKFPASNREEDKEICMIKWNGKRFDAISGWGMVKREFPIYDIQEIIRRYLNKLNWTINSE